MSAADDLGRFLQIAEHIESRKSLREIAEAMRMPHQTVHDAITRLEKYYGATLFERPPTARQFRLSPDGNALLQKVRDCLKPLSHQNTPIRIRIAQSLLQSRSLLGAIKGGVTQLARNAGTSIELSANIDLNDPLEIENLLTGQLDLLLCWGLPQRIARFQKSAGVQVKEIGAECPIVLISHSMDIIKRCFTNKMGTDPMPWQPITGKVDFEEMIQFKFAVLDHDKQPLDEQLVQHGIYVHGTRRVRAASFPMIVEMVRAGIADVGLIPLMGTELQSYLISDELFYQVLPLDDNGIRTPIRIAAVFQKTLNERKAKPLPKSVQDRLTLVENITLALDPWLERSPASLTWDAILRPLPLSPEFYKRLIHGYYLYCPDDNIREGDSIGTTKWYHETLHNFVLIPDEEGSKLRLSPTTVALINNIRGQTYYIDDVCLLDGALCLRAIETKDSAKERSSGGFISVFSASVMLGNDPGILMSENNPAIIVGTWNGGGGRKTALATWATIYSSVELSPDTLNVISRIATVKFNFASTTILEHTSNKTAEVIDDSE